jgi:hypothetical protein
MYSENSKGRMPTINHRHWKRYIMFDSYQVFPDIGGLNDQDASFVDFVFMCLDRKAVHQQRRNNRLSRKKGR